MNFNGQKVAVASKFAGDDLDYGVDYYYTADPPFLKVDESIVSSTWEVANPDAELVLYNEVFTLTGTAVWIRGGAKAKVYVIKNTITTNQARTCVAKINLWINPEL